MATRDLVLIGASAGGVEALLTLTRALPADLPAAVGVVLHLPPTGSDALARILDRTCALPVHTAEDGMPLQHGVIVVAPAGRHLLVRGQRFRLSRGPRENGHRPSVDALFRSGARMTGPRTVGVVLSGSLDDGAAGLAAITARGGAGIVQDPEDAMFPGMPEAAIALDFPGWVVPIAEMAGAIAAALAQEVVQVHGDGERDDDVLRVEDEIAGMEATSDQSRQVGQATPLSCPDCSGVLHELPSPEAGPRYRCVVGHAWSPKALYEEQAEAVERALWMAARALEERAALARRMTESARARGHEISAARFAERAEDEHQQALLLRELLERGELRRTSPREDAS